MLTTYVCLLTWAQRELFRLVLDAPSVLAGFSLVVKHVYNAGYSGDSGTRICLELGDSTESIRRRIQEKSSETMVLDIVAQEMGRVNNFCKKLGFLNTVKFTLSEP